MEPGRIEILGRYYTLSGVSDQEYLEKLADFVSDHMKKIIEATDVIDTQKVAIYASLTIADELFRAQQEHKKADEEFEKKIDALSDQIKIAIEN